MVTEIVGKMMNAKNTQLDHNEVSQEPWWVSLPEDFHQMLHVTGIDNLHRLKVKSSAAIDGVLRLGLASAVAGAMSPHILSPTRVRKDIHNLEFYQNIVDQGDREAVFSKPPKDSQVIRERVAPSRYLPVGAKVELLRNQSTFQTLNPAVRSEYAKSHFNGTATAQYWQHPDGPRPTLIFTHGFLVDAPRFNNYMFSLSWFYEQGYDILLHTLPFHGTRRGKLDVLSGMGYFSHGFAHMNEAFLQGVYDLRGWMNFLEAQGVTAMGVSGYSLGGYTSASAACADDRLKFVIPNSPAVVLIDMIRGWAPTNLALGHIMKNHHLTLKNFRHMTAVHCPLSWKPVIAPERLMIIGGAGDRFTSPQFVNALHKHWSGSEMHWFPGNHVMHLNKLAYLRLMKEFMDKNCAN
jgi:hypothetical protein